MKRSRTRTIAKALVALVAVVTFTFALSACSQGGGAVEEEASSSEVGNPFVGTWEIVSQEKVHNEDLEAEKAAGHTRIFYLEEDGTARAEHDGEVIEGTYRQVSDTAAKLLISDPLWSGNMSLEGNLLVVMSSDDLRYRFERIDEAGGSADETTETDGAGQ